MSQKFKSEIELQALNNATTYTDKILVSDGGVIKYRTGEQVRSDIGAQAALTNPVTGTGTTNRLPKFTGATSLGDSQIFDNGTNVGIGTTSPTSLLDVRGTIRAGHVLQLQYGAGTYGTNVTVLALRDSTPDPSTQFFNGLQYNNSSGFTELKSSSTLSQDYTANFIINSKVWNGTGYTNTERMRITSAGNVGIGTTSPNSLLQIGNLSSSDPLLTLGVSYNTSRTARGGIVWRDATNITSKIFTEFDGTQVSMNFGSLFNSGYNSNTLMTIRGNGNVGIGTTSPGVALHIARAGEVALDLQDTLGQNYRFFSRNSDKTLGIFDVTNGRTFFRHVGNATVGSTRLSLMENGGNVFIGNTADQTGCLTQIQRTGSSRLLSLFNTTAQGGAKIEFFDGTSNGAVGNLGGNLIFYVNSRDTERMRIDSSGNVGIGVSTMGGRLNIAGSSSDAWASANGGLTLNGNSSGGISTITTFLDASSIRIGAGTTQKTGILITGQSSASGSTVQFSTGASERMRITGTGNVGIGTSNPTNKLQVNGTVSFSDGFTEIYAGSGESYMASYNTGAYFYTGLDGTGFADTAIMGSKNTYTSDDVVLGVQGADASGNQDFLTSRNLLKESGPINPDSPVMWIKIFNQNDGGTYFIPAYQ